MTLSLRDVPIDALASVAAMLPLRDSVGSLARVSRLFHAVVSTAMLTVAHLTACPGQKFWQAYRYRIERITVHDARRLPSVASPLLQSLTLNHCNRGTPLFSDTSTPQALTRLEVPAIHHEGDAKVIPWAQLEQLSLTDCKSMGVSTVVYIDSAMSRSTSLKRLRCGRPTWPMLNAVCRVSHPCVSALKIDRAFDMSSPTVWIGIQFGFPQLSQLTIEGCLLSDCHIVGAAWQESLRVLHITDTTLGDDTLRRFVSQLKHLTHATLTKSRFTCRAIEALLLDTAACPRLREVVVDSRIAAGLAGVYDVIGATRPGLQIRTTG